MPPEDELHGWLRLLLTPGLGRSTARRLLAAMGTPERIARASETARAAVLGPSLARAWADAGPATDDALARTRAWLAQAPDRSIVTLGDPGYPAPLLATEDPPLLLHLQGQAALLQCGLALAIVGSRNPTAQGLDNARAFAAHLAGRGWVIVSGLALGIDGAAHGAALDAAGTTIAVVGTGLDRVYPARHQALAQRIARHGLLVSEFPLGTPPLAPHFPMRNRIIAGLSRGTLVVEAALQSGSLITARMSVEAGREVFAIPGSIHAPQARGCHALIKQGAKLVESADDVLSELGGAGDGAAAGTPSDAADPDPPDDPLMRALGHDPCTLDALVDRTGRTVAELGARLLELELDGLVERLPGGLYQRRRTA